MIPARTRNATADPDHEPAPMQRKVERGPVNAVQEPHDQGLGFLELLGQQERGQHRRHGECRDERAGERIAVGTRHGSENLPFDALHGEQRPERGDGDGGREQDGLCRPAAPIRKSSRSRIVQVGHGCRGRIVAIGTLPQRLDHLLLHDSAWTARFRKMFSTRITAESMMMPKSTAPMDRRLASWLRKTMRMMEKNKRERNVHADDDGAAQVAEEDPLDQEHQQTAENEIVQNRVRGHARRAWCGHNREPASRPAGACRRRSSRRRPP